MARETKGGLDFDANGDSALDKLLFKKMANPRVNIILLSRPIPERGKRQGEQEIPMPQPKPKKTNNPKVEAVSAQVKAPVVERRRAQVVEPIRTLRVRKGKRRGNGKPFISMPR